jgi:Amt family ammonium transporter
MFFMKAGFLYIEQAFAKSDVALRRRVVLAKYLDTFGSTLGFFLFGFAISTGEEGGPFLLGENADYVFWFFRFTFASNTATILGGLLVGGRVQLRAISVFIYAFAMSAFIHPMIARMAWVVGVNSPLSISPFRYCNGTARASVLTQHRDDFHPAGTGFIPLVYIDFAGSGTVHLLGGMAGFVLAIFHKAEMKHKGPFFLFKKCCSRKKQKKEITAQEENDEGRDTAKRRPTVDEDTDNASERPEIKCPRRLIAFHDFLDWMYPSGGGGENVESAALGVIILWTTWFAFNAGSTESISGVTFHAVVGRIALVMAVAAASGGLTSTIVCGLVQIYKRDNGFNTNEIANGMLACLVAVTGCCPFIDPLWALLIGPLTILFYHIGCWIVYQLDLQDGARIFPLHGICGLWGVLCVGIFYEKCLVLEIYGSSCFCNQYIKTEFARMLSQPGLIFAYQLAGGVIIILLAVLFCGALFFALWVIPVKLIYYVTGLYWIFNFPDKPQCGCTSAQQERDGESQKKRKKYERKGEVNFKGNVLFTHFDEIKVPIPDAGDIQLQSIQPR